MIVIVQTSNGVEVFRFDQGRPDSNNIPTYPQIVEALQQADNGVPKDDQDANQEWVAPSTERAT